MILDALKNQLQNFLAESEYSDYLLKVWIYKDKCVVLDFEFKTIRFALDIEIDENLKSDIYLVDRNSHLNFLKNKTTLKRNRVFSSVENKSIEGKVNSFLSDIIFLIESEFKYKISVIVPVYNREKLILKCIESLNKQTLEKNDFEVIFVDDCSTDNTVKVIEDTCSKQLNYCILKRPVGSGNASAPRNDGLKKAKGKYVFFLDSDDYISMDCLEKALEFSESNQSDVTYLKIGSDIDYPRNIPVAAFKKGTVKKATVYLNNLMRSNASCKFYDRVFLIINSFNFDTSIPLKEDKLFNVQVISRTKNVSILADKPYIFITSHDEQHLSKSKYDIFSEQNLYLNGFNWIYTSPLDKFHLNELYNAWFNILLERIVKIIKSDKYNQSEKNRFFKNVTLNVFNQDFEIFEDQLNSKNTVLINHLKLKDYCALNDLKEIIG